MSGRPPSHGALGLTRALPLALLVVLACPVRTASAAPPAEEAATDWIRPEEVPTRADALLRKLDAAQPDAAAQASLAEIEQALPRLDRNLDAVLERARAAVEKSLSPTDLEDIRSELTESAAPLAGWNDRLAAEAKRVAESLDLIARAEHVWSATLDRPETRAAGDVVVRRVESSIRALHDTAARLRAWRERVLTASDRVVDRVTAVDAALEQLRTASDVERRNLFVPDRPPLWSTGLGDMGSELPRVPAEIVAYARSTIDYVRRDPRPLLAQALLAGILMLALGRVAPRARRRLAGDDASARAARLMERPYAAGLLFALLASPVFQPLAPRRFMQLAAMLALFPAARIVVHVAERADLPVFFGLFALLLLDRVELAIAALPSLQRATYLLSLMLGIGLAAWALRRIRSEPSRVWLRRAAVLAIVGLGLSLLAEIGGWTHLATVVGRGILAGAIAALYIYAAALALSALLAYALTSRTLQRSHLVRRRAAMLQRQVERALRWLAVAAWLYLVCTAIGLRSLAGESLAGFLAAGVSAGALSLSVGGVLAFVLTLVIALVLARIVDGVLEEDVYPRARLPRGVPYALSTLIRYGVYALGLLFALAAAGVQPGQVTILVGGLGIGIGLGLQDLVKNFAAGLTLILERRINVGDTLEMPSQGIFGHVLAIGMRASVVRTYSGAEVVVPNADLISSAVTNWTLSDRLCRIEVPVGVAYGVDPEHVVALLLEAVASTGRLLADPAPQVLFKGFGDSSLDFVVRAWTDQGYDEALSLTSVLGLAVNRTLAAAGIAIPFPQRDLHLASVSPSASAALSREDRKE